MPTGGSPSAPTSTTSSDDKPGDASTTSSEISEGGASRRSDGDVTSSSSQELGPNNNDPEPANISWFRNQDYDLSGFISIDELMVNHQVTVIGFFLPLYKIATTLVDLLFIELRSHLSHVKQMFSQPIHLTHELILCLNKSLEEG